jgi:hypothetical protein
MRFEWDEVKRAGNLRKRGIDFADLAPIFESRMLVTIDRRRDYGEVRYIGIGIVGGRELTVVWTERSGAIRWISARRAHAKERARYQVAEKAE